MTICPECSATFPDKMGKTYCSRKCQKKVCDRRNDAKRKDRQSEKGRMHRMKHPDYDRNRMANLRAKYGRNDGPYAQLLDELYKPIEFESDACIVAPDWHIPFYHTGYVSWLLDMADDYGIHDIAIPGDFIDADAYSRWPKDMFRESWQSEIEQAGMMLTILSDHFDRIFISKGNHENRFMLLQPGCQNMELMFRQCGKWPLEKVVLSDDTAMTMNKHSDNPWMFCHPKQFRQTPLSVARDLAAKYHRHIVSAHGHFFGQGLDRSGRFYCLDGGGLFDPYALAYLRQVTTTPWVMNGFYIIERDGYIPFSLGNEWTK
jgi:hypothetical protein